MSRRNRSVNPNKKERYSKKICNRDGCSKQIGWRNCNYCSDRCRDLKIKICVTCSKEFRTTKADVTACCRSVKCKLCNVAYNVPVTSYELFGIRASFGYDTSMCGECKAHVKLCQNELSLDDVYKITTNPVIKRPDFYEDHVIIIDYKKTYYERVGGYDSDPEYADKKTVETYKSMYPLSTKIKMEHLINVDNINLYEYGELVNTLYNNKSKYLDEIYDIEKAHVYKISTLPKLD